MDAVIKEKEKQQQKGWRHQTDSISLPEVNKTMKVPKKGSFLRKFMAFIGPGYLVAVGYMDPGNWATDLAGGSMFGYTLLSVILISNLMAILLQALSVRLGIASGKDLAQACRDHYIKPISFALWLLCELAIAACDLAEVIGSAIALKLLFGIPLLYGVLITAFDVILVLLLQKKGFRLIEAIVISLILLIGVCFVFDIALSQPNVAEVMKGFVPTAEIVQNPEMLYIALGILGATVMPHNLYLHSSIVQTRDYERTTEGKRSAIRYATWDSSIALMLALFVNAAILIVSAATFHTVGREVSDIEAAYELLGPMLGTGAASIVFGVALLASGQSSTLTGTLAGQIVMEGFLNIRLKPWLRRLITRLIAIIPAVVVTAIYGEQGTADLLVFSQVILSLQLSFAVIPLVKFTSDKYKMGELAAPKWMSYLSWVVAIVIACLNIYLLYQTIFPGLLVE
ncbi:putative manganese transport protein MntH [Paenibacillus larvae subsp. larvae]|uniref:Divalent metal cation transporter MntH n=1 Tax=Paenibacillus larvae subsp. larvae TaxID=147375 RepID=A0A2L1TXN6_9BACL|nr:Nramp family divalent metal transporter [Paenibacillus larvae]AQT85991.1 divalent metal cation transporter [Paenibacillus larvae subsp. pulvifaciens]AQZ45766.1 divalent metal cation transporter [Paenibacillus larvae subsp. pulvifaciens]AVF25449.1 putative manganese transport protein MntH [Paenibacillus larvae subsp. larvae]AVF30226.1 putative manganese transport protein MntH [Paenibacillus larvae subsp. larvae]MBH0342922.1 manganese transporter [Paenibacillus larvae]